MKTSESILKIAPALLEAQKKIGAAKKEGRNPYFKSSYATLGDVMEACKDILNANGVTVLQPVGTDEVGVYVETVLLHTSGEWISDRLKIAPKSDIDPQAQGSAISYARRYGLQSMVFIPAEDDDAEKATSHAPTATVEAKKAIVDDDPDWIESFDKATSIRKCSIHNVSLLRALSKTKVTKEGNPKPYWYHPTTSGMCFGNE